MQEEPTAANQEAPPKIPATALLTATLTLDTDQMQEALKEGWTMEEIRASLKHDGLKSEFILDAEMEEVNFSY